MILKSLSNKGDIFPSSSNAEGAQYNKCKYCEKVFLNQLYLQSHLSRRHADVIEIPQKDKQANETNNENVKMNAEIMELKIKLKDMEQTIMKKNTVPEPKSPENRPPVTVENKKEERNVKDAEVSTNNEDYLLDKFEQWKKEEHEKYDKEIQHLRSQIMETINAIKDKQIQQPENKDSKVIEQLQSTIVQQGAELLALKQELNNSVCFIIDKIIGILLFSINTYSYYFRKSLPLLKRIINLTEKQKLKLRFGRSAQKPSLNNARLYSKNSTM